MCDAVFTYKCTQNKERICSNTTLSSMHQTRKGLVTKCGVVTEIDANNRVKKQTHVLESFVSECF